MAEAKTLYYEHADSNGWLTACVKGVLCNWMVALGTVLGLSSTSSTGKLASIWLPVSTFFALALEHSIVNMFVIPTAMMLGADITMTQWLVWDQIPVTLGNVIGGAVLTGLLLHYGNRTHPVSHQLGQALPMSTDRSGQRDAEPITTGGKVPVSLRT